MSKPDMGALIEGLVIPNLSYGTDVALVEAMVGATVMAHNLFLHSHLVQSRKIDRTQEAKVEEAMTYFSLEFGISMVYALIINIAVVVSFAAHFYPSSGIGLEEAGQALEGQLGSSAKTLWGIGIFASGQASTMTGTYAGQFVMEGFLDIPIPYWKRSLFTRLIALVPAMIVSIFYTTRHLNGLNSFVNTLQGFIPPFVIFVMLKFLKSPVVMGKYALPWSSIIALGLTGLAIVAFNLSTAGFAVVLTGSSTAVAIATVFGGAVYFALLAYIVWFPIGELESHTPEQTGLLAEAPERHPQKAE